MNENKKKLLLNITLHDDSQSSQRNYIFPLNNNCSLFILKMRESAFFFTVSTILLITTTLHTKFHFVGVQKFVFIYYYFFF